MAREIVVNVGLGAKKGSLEVSKRVLQRFDLAGETYAGGAVAVTDDPAGTPLDLSSLPRPGWGFFRNTGKVPVQLGRSVSGTFIEFDRLLPGEPAVKRLATLDVVTRAEGPGAVLEYLVLAE